MSGSCFSDLNAFPQEKFVALFIAVSCPEFPVLAYSFKPLGFDKV